MREGCRAPAGGRVSPLKLVFRGYTCSVAPGVPRLAGELSECIDGRGGTHSATNVCSSAYCAIKRCTRAIATIPEVFT